MSQVNLIDDGHVERLQRDRDHEVDRTPVAVARQGIGWAGPAIEADPRKRAIIIDICAGAGVFSMAAREIMPLRTRVGVEIREEERQNLERHCDEVVIGDAISYAADAPTDVSATIGNPAFSIFPDLLRLYYPISKVVLFYGSMQWGCSKAGAELFAEFAPYACARVTGRVGHRGPGINPKNGLPWGADQHDHGFWLWMHDKVALKIPKFNALARDRVEARAIGETILAEWLTVQLPYLPDAERRWIVPPGSEP